MTHSQTTKYYRYLENILSGKVNHGEHIKVLCQSLHKDLNDKNCKYEFREEIADRYIGFIEKLRFSEGQWAKTPFLLQDWQAFIIGNIFGWIDKETKLRRFKDVTIHVPKKNGKTAMMAAIAIAYSILDKDYAGQIFMAATGRDQAGICFKAVKRTIEVTPYLSSKFNVFQHSVVNPKNHCVIKALSADASTAEGNGGSLVIFDEYHLQKTDELKENLITGMAARAEPLFISISTAGSDKTAPYFRHINLCKNILSNNTDIDSHFVVIYESDNPKKWDDPSTWAQANPNYGVSVLVNNLQREFKEANSDPSKVPSFITKHLNIWADAATTWIDSRVWRDLGTKLSIEEFAGDEAYLGLDLALSGDFSALNILIRKDNKFYLMYRYYIPELQSSRRSQADKMNFKHWQNQGYVTITDGNVTDFDVIEKDILTISRILDVKILAYDIAYAEHLCTRLREDHGINAVPFDQGIRATSPPAMLFQRMVLGGEIIHDGNPITQWMLGNVALYYDNNGNFKLSKNRSRDKIDGISATVNAIGAFSKDYAENYGYNDIIIC